MNASRRGLAALVLGSALALPAHAQNMKPGLWEITNNMTSSDGVMQAKIAEMQKQMAAIPAEQRKMMEQMMAKQGVQLSVKDGAGITTRMCMTREMAEHNEVPLQQNGDCTQKRTPGAGGTMKVSFSCKDPKITGEGEVSFQGDSSYRMKMKVSSEQSSGMPEKMNVDTSAKWLGADCGNVRPLQVSKAR